MKQSHRLFTVLIMLSMVLGLFSMPAFSSNSVALAQDEVPPETEPLAQIDDAQSTTGPTPPPEVLESLYESVGYSPTANANTISGVPAYEWRHGCGPTAAGMVIGYWDGYYDDKGVDWLIDGDSSTQTTAANEAMASQAVTPSHYSDYSLPIDDSGSMQLDNSSLLPPASRHPNDSIADFMKTSWSFRGNQYGWSYLSDVQPAMLGYAAMRNPGGFTVTSTTVSGMSWTAFQAEINAGRPVVLLVDSSGDGGTDHFIPAVGYDTTAGGTKMYAAYTTWDTDLHWFTFHSMSNGDAWGIYSGTTFKITTAASSTPSLLAPVSNSVTNNTMPTLSWKPAANATAYHLQVSTSSAFSGTVVDDDTITDTFYTPGSAWSGKLYWRVRSQNVGGSYSSWSSYRYFTVDTLAPAAPLLKAPLSGTTPLGIPTFSWYASPTATRYQFQYNTSNNPGDEDPASVTYRSAELTSTSHKPLTMPMVQYYWFARAKDPAGNWSAWSAPFTVTVLPLKPSTPALLLPASNAYTKDTTPELTWKSVTYGHTYQVQISTTSSFSSTVFVDETVSGTIFTDGDYWTSLPDGKYYWHVRAINENSVAGSWSSYRYFTVDTLAPDAPLLKLPLSGAEPLGIPTFSWTKPLGTPVRYQFQYNTSNNPGDEDPASVTFRSAELTSTSFKPLTMPMVEYYWFARAKDAAGNWSAWSAPFTVKVLPLKPGTPSLVSPVSGLETNRDTIQLTWKSVPYGYTYHVQIATDSAFTSIVQDAEGISDLTLTSDVLQNGKYYWRVQARNENNVYGSWSSARNFSVFSGFNSQFNGDATGWSRISGGNWYVDSSQYYSDGAQYAWTQARQTGNASNFTYEVRMNQSSSGWSRGIMVRANSTFSSGYMFVQTKYYDWDYSKWTYIFSIWKFVSGSATPLQWWTESPSLADGWNTLKVVANGSALEFHINNNLVWSGTDTKFTRGLIGLRMYRGTSIERINVDWATLDIIDPLAAAQSSVLETGQIVLPFDPNIPYGPEQAPK